MKHDIICRQMNLIMKKKSFVLQTINKKRIKLPGVFTACLMMTFLQQSIAQTDPHFTQNYTYPMYINPALTGSSDGEYRVSAIYRSQWGAIGNPYRTVGLSFDTRTNKNISLGVN